MKLSDNAQGALWMSASMMGFVFNDTLLKSTSAELAVFQAIFLRGFVASVMVVALAWQTGALRYRPRPADRRRLGWRMVADVMATLLFVSAIFNMRLANAMAILMVSPLAVTLAAAWFLQEPVGWRRYSAIVVGFFGVVLIVGPGTEGLNLYALAALAAVGFVVLRDLSARTFSTDMPSLLPTIASVVSVTVCAGLLTLVTEWRDVRWEIMGRIAFASALLIVGFYAGFRAMRVGEIGVVSSFRYTNLLWALALGFIAFGEIPSTVALIGAAIVLAAGLYTLHRERLRSRSS